MQKGHPPPCCGNSHVGCDGYQLSEVQYLSKRPHRPLTEEHDARPPHRRRAQAALV